MTQIEKISRVLAVPPPPLAPEAGDDWLDVQALYRMVRRRIGLIVLVMALVLSAAAPQILSMKRSFAASARVLIYDPLPAALTSSLLTSDEALNLTTEGERLLSRDVSVQVISELGLGTREEFNPALSRPTVLERLKAELRRLVAGGESRSTSAVDQTSQIVQAYLGHLSIARAAGSDVVTITFRSHDAELAAEVPNALIRVYLEKRERQLRERRARVETWLGRRLAEQRDRLAQAQTALDAFRAESESASLAGRDAADALSALTQRDEELEQSRAETLARLTALQRTGSLDRQIGAANSDALDALGRDLALARTALAPLLDRYGSEHPEVVAARARVSGLEAEAEAELNRQRQRLTSNLAALAQEEDEINAKLATARQAVVDQRRVDDRLAQLQKSVDAEHDGLERLDEQSRALHAEADLPPAEVEVLSPASVPLTAEGRGPAYYLAVALFAAATLSLTVAFLREMLDRTVRSQEQLLRVPGTAPAGLLPMLPRRALRRPLDRRWQGKNELYRDSVEAVILAIEERGDGTIPQSLLVTSALAGEGKSEVAMALATELAASGRNVLLVDADPRGGKLHERFGLPAAPGLADYLAGDVQLADVIRHDSASGLSFIARGSARPRRDPDRTRAKALVSAAAAVRQHVIFDSTPVLVANESVHLGAVSAGTLLVVQWGRTARSAVEAAVERLCLRGRPDIAVVLSRVDLRRQALYGYRDAGETARSLRRRYLRHG